MPQAREAHSWEDLFTAEEMETARDTDLPDLLTSLGYLPRQESWPLFHHQGDG